MHDLMFSDVPFTKDGWKSLLGKMQLGPRMTELSALISWEGNSIRNILLNTYSVPTIMKGPKGNKDRRLSLSLQSSQCRETHYNTSQRGLIPVTKNTLLERKECDFRARD